MKHSRFGLTLGVKEHLLAGNTITRLEALVLFGVSNLPDVIKEMRKGGWTIESRTTPFAAAVKKVNEHAVLEPPSNLPIREIQLTEYWVSK
jgi:hypothetical protein